MSPDDLTPADRNDAARADAEDPLEGFRRRFAIGPQPVAYLDGNSLGRPPSATLTRVRDLLHDEWALGLIGSWERWVNLPTEVGDELGGAVLGAAPGQTIVADSTSVTLFKALHAAAALRPGRVDVIVQSGEFPTDRYLVDAVAAARGLTVRRIDAHPVLGITGKDLVDSLGEQTAVLVLSHVDYRSGALADLAGLTAQAHAAGAVVVWDLSHSAGVVPLALDEASVDFAVGCTYKYLNAGPGAPAFLYAATRHHDDLHNPVPGWFGTQDVFAMAEEYAPAVGVRRMLSGTPPVPGLVAVQEGVRLVAEAGVDRIRAKGRRLTEVVAGFVEQDLVRLGWRLASPVDSARRGSHVVAAGAGAEVLVRRLAARGVVADFRNPDLVRFGLSPLTTSYSELELALTVVGEEAERLSG